MGSPCSKGVPAAGIGPCRSHCVSGTRARKGVMQFVKHPNLTRPQPTRGAACAVVELTSDPDITTLPDRTVSVE